MAVRLLLLVLVLVPGGLRVWSVCRPFLLIFSSQLLVQVQIRAMCTPRTVDLDLDEGGRCSGPRCSHSGAVSPSPRTSLETAKRAGCDGQETNVAGRSE